MTNMMTMDNELGRLKIRVAILTRTVTICVAFCSDFSCRVMDIEDSDKCPFKPTAPRLRIRSQRRRSSCLTSRLITCIILSYVVLIIMPSPVLEVFPFRIDTHQTLFRQDARRQSSTIDTSSIETDCMFVLLQTAVGVVSKQDRLGSIPKASPRPIGKEFGCHCPVGEDGAHIHHEARVLFG
jgi:hypothetical protein